ncbi:alkaline phosphatase family protein [Luteibaculum oceani]|uniref:Alkaline phosphatase family protein n=1 Tax=Luteibaculum oceani TaxID=1294296 RepID=A0A5C6V436_9FLAO|nr:alkaline phosphatase family protein [Luteibaculum oceani]TXC78448.1 alkaline phosphatase family protein [Luteibaculum oceani]
MLYANSFFCISSHCKKRIGLFGLFLFLGACSFSEKTHVDIKHHKLLIGITVDQMRFDYLQRFDTLFIHPNGFKRLTQQGVNFTQTKYSYFPTYTGPGHATIFTGANPKHHGIVGNDWYDKSLGKYVYCVSDTTENTIGSNSGAGQMSPHHLLVPSIGDYFKEFFGQTAKVYGISLKDRSAILPTGFNGDAAFWWDGGKQGKFITSTYYMSQIGEWVDQFNESGYADRLLESDWTLSPLLSKLDLDDDLPWERPFKGMKAAVFPYELSKLRLINGDYSLLKQVPQGNELISAFAKKLIENEQLGLDTIPDFLSLSFSATDYVGHRFGTESLELVDVYFKLDKVLGDFFSYLDQKIGRDNYTVFLSSDHGAAPPAGFAMVNLARGGTVNPLDLELELRNYLQNKGLPQTAVRSLINQQIYLDTAISGHQTVEVKKEIISFLKAQPFVEETLDAVVFSTGISAAYNGRHFNAAKAGYHPKRSGDIFYFLKPNWVEYPEGGSTHGSFDDWDRHVPFLLWNSSLNRKHINTPIDVVDIAPTVFEILDFKHPNTFSGISRYPVK